MAQPWDTFFVLGAPGAGKTTIGRAVALVLDGTFRSIDDWTPRGQPMSDAQVHDALCRLFESMSASNEVAEFSHHDYMHLLKTNACPLFTTSRKVILAPPLSLCLSRNRLRQSAVREAYVERAWRSAQALGRHCSTTLQGNAIVLDTSNLTVDAAVAAVTDFVTNGRGI